MLNYSNALMESIEREKKGTDYIYSESDKEILDEMLWEINQCASTDFHYLAELDTFNIPGSGIIIARYITRFSSESVRAYLISQIVFDKIKDCDKLILKLYLHFKNSDVYISAPEKPAPAHIYARYDNAFRLLKPKRIKEELLQLAYCPRDAFYLPFTMRLLASWKIPKFGELLISYLAGNTITAQSVGLQKENESFYPPLTFIKRELKFTAIAGLRYYSSPDVIELIKQYTVDDDFDIRAAAQKVLKKLDKA